MFGSEWSASWPGRGIDVGTDWTGSWAGAWVMGIFFRTQKSLAPAGNRTKSPRVAKPVASPLYRLQHPFPLYYHKQRIWSVLYTVPQYLHIKNLQKHYTNAAVHEQYHNNDKRATGGFVSRKLCQQLCFIVGRYTGQIILIMGNNTWLCHLSACRHLLRLTLQI